MKLSELDLRRPDFDASGFAVTLADGQEWRIPPVRIRVFPDDAGEIRYRPWYAGALEDELDILFGVVPVTEGMGDPFVDLPLKIAATLLRRNYDLPPGSVGRLLTYFPGDAASEGMLRKVTRAVLGRDPEAADPEDDDPKAGDAATDGSDAGHTPAGS